MASTSSDKFDIGEAKRLGANGYLVKGKAFDVRELRNFLQQDELEWLEITE